MKLLYSTTSPYVRKVRMFIYIAGLQSRVNEELVNPFESTSLKSSNPLGKIPVLVDGDKTIIDSPLICEYLDEIVTQAGNPSLFLRGQEGYFDIQLLHVRANGIIDAAVSSLLENRRTDAEQSQHWLQKWYGTIRRSIETLDTSTLANTDTPNMGTIALAAALGYLDFRFEDFAWRSWNAALANWFEDIQACDWFKATAPE